MSKSKTHSTKSANNWPLLARSSPAGLAIATRNRFDYPAHIQLIDKSLVRLKQRRIKRLAIFLPPRHGKSMMVSQYLPAWWLGTSPDEEIILASYEADFAAGWGRKVRDLLEEYGPQFYGVELDQRSSARNRFHIKGRTGGMSTAGVGGAQTGKGASCCLGDTLIKTEVGWVAVERLIGMKLKPRVASWNHDRQRVEYREILATYKGHSYEHYEISTDSGHYIRATGNHRLFLPNRGYAKAEDLWEGDGLFTLPQKQDMSEMRTKKEHTRPTVPLLLNQTTLGRYPNSVCSLREASYQESVRDTKGNQTRQHSTLLWTGVQSGAPRCEEPEEVCDLWSADREQDEEVLRASLPRGGASFTQPPNEAMFCLSGDVSTKGEPADVLQSRLCQPSTFDGNKRISEPISLEQMVSGFEETNNLPGQRTVCCLQEGGEFGSSPCQRHRDGSSTRKYGDRMSTLSHNPPQLQETTIHMVKKIRAGSNPVYDIQVEGNSNYFAGGILVHNCLIIDDPIKNAEQAESEVYRERAWDWFRSVATTRLTPDGVVALVMTRWHADDLAGRILDENYQSELDDDNKWEVISLPAIADAPDDALGRARGEALWPEQFNTENLSNIRASIGTHYWQSLYQQTPTAESGNEFKREWFRYYTPARLPHAFSEVLQSWDMAFTDTSDASYVVGQVWGADVGNYYLLRQVRQRMGFTQTVEAVARLTQWTNEHYPGSHRILVEDKANGPAVIDSLKRSIPGIIPVNPGSSKLARARAVTPAFESGNVYLEGPEGSPPRYVVDYVEELCSFPLAKHDDQVDATSQALSRLTKATSTRRGVRVGARQPDYLLPAI